MSLNNWREGLYGDAGLAAKQQKQINARTNDEDKVALSKRLNDHAYYLIQSGAPEQVWRPLQAQADEAFQMHLQGLESHRQLINTAREQYYRKRYDRADEALSLALRLSPLPDNHRVEILSARIEMFAAAYVRHWSGKIPQKDEIINIIETDVVSMFDEAYGLLHATDFCCPEHFEWLYAGLMKSWADAQYQIRAQMPDVDNGPDIVDAYERAIDDIGRKLGCEEGQDCLKYLASDAVLETIRNGQLTTADLVYEAALINAARLIAKLETDKFAKRRGKTIDFDAALLETTFAVLDAAHRPDRDFFAPFFEARELSLLAERLGFQRKALAYANEAISHIDRLESGTIELSRTSIDGAYLVLARLRAEQCDAAAAYAAIEDRFGVQGRHTDAFDPKAHALWSELVHRILEENCYGGTEAD